MMQNNAERKPVGILSQCLMSLFVPTGLYAFKRIRKFRLGLIVYGLSYIAYLAATITTLNIIAKGNMTSDQIGILSLLSTILVIISFALPTMTIYNWSKRYNQSIKTG